MSKPKETYEKDTDLKKVGEENGTNSNRNGSGVDNNAANRNDRRNPSNNGRSGKQNRRKDASRRKVSYDKIRTNDIKWYNKSAIYKDAVRIPFNRIPGDPVENKLIMPYLTNGDNLTVFQPTAVNDVAAAAPGVMCIEYVPTLGVSADNNSPVNRAFMSIYIDMYSKTSGVTQFQPADLALLSLGLSSIMTNIALVKRALGVINLGYVNNNYYYPDTLLTAMGVDPATMRGSQDEVRRRLNLAISNLNGLNMPSFIDLFQRQYQLAHNIYADENTPNAQLFLFKPLGYYTYVDISDDISELAHLKYTPFTQDLQKGTDIFKYLDIIDAQLASWRNSSDLGIIGAAVKRAYAESDLIRLDFAVPDELVVPVYDRVMLWQINNATMVDSVYEPSLHVTQDAVKNSVIQVPEVSIQAGLAMSEMTILNSYDGTNDDVFITEATRLITKIAPKYSAKPYNPVITSGTEIVTRAVIYYRKKATADGTITLGAFGLEGVMRINTAVENTVAKLATKAIYALSTTSIASQFRNAPRWCVVIGDNASAKYSGMIGDLHVWTLVDNVQLSGLNEAVFQSIYVINVPIKTE